ncbi:MAG: cysteine desulfurase [Ignavibacteriae bacterium]|nr:cysteine desulfurase [Ignavibacteriota bacterium]
MKVYFDTASTTKLHPKVLDAMLPYLTDNFGNPSSIHSFGSTAKVAVEDARETIANLINADPSEIYFTGSGSEANNFCIRGIAQTEFLESGRNHIVTSSVEHLSVLNTTKYLEEQNFEVSLVSPNEQFITPLQDIISKINDSTSLLSFIYTNNETGVKTDIKGIRNSIDSNIFLHTDAVQTFGKFKIDVKEIGVDALSTSAHKIQGPKGIGFAYVKNGTPMNSLIIGGGQERNRRAGTENVAYIVGFAEAAKLAHKNMESNSKVITKLREYFIDKISNLFENIIFNQSDDNSPNILSLTFSPFHYSIDPEAMLMIFDINGIAVSSGSACSSGTFKPSHVIVGSDQSLDYAKGTLRFSFSADNTFNEVDYAISVLEKISVKYQK